MRKALAIAGLLASMALAAPAVRGESITLHFAGTVTDVDGGDFDDSVTEGTPFSAYYAFDTSAYVFTDEG